MLYFFTFITRSLGLLHSFIMMKFTIMNMWSKWLRNMRVYILSCENIDSKNIYANKGVFRRCDGVNLGDCKRIQKSFLLFIYVIISPDISGKRGPSPWDFRAGVAEVVYKLSSPPATVHLWCSDPPLNLSLTWFPHRCNTFLSPSPGS